MKIQVVLFLILSIVALISSQDYTPTEQELQDTFLSWMQAYEISYTSEEFQAKYNQWKLNLAAIAKNNADITQPDGVFNQPKASDALLANADFAFEAEPVVTYPEASQSQLSLNRFSDLSYTEFVSTYAGADATLAATAATAAVLSTGAIIGIAVGGAAAVGGVAGATVYVVKKKRSNKTKTVAAETELEQPSSSNDNFKRQGATNIFNMDNPHHSITARAAYN
ncbi:hypothetical protein CYY_004087 [Polysphondylium violaceum]|uniref:Cathepsin propeptide inhibitor domain-containing protein n=1 Tax=Polysphondylium violaceum TaxID=133409 RepID=A0A8J4PVT0_9MYCE|nr:hypothetical protein CYY_004087 [Polysphondylium violaceum]